MQCNHKCHHIQFTNVVYCTYHEGKIMASNNRDKKRSNYTYNFNGKVLLTKLKENDGNISATAKEFQVNILYNYHMFS